MEAQTIRQEVDRRRTFGIISHPDAGKTTLTEQLLLMGGAIRLAGDVRARKTRRHATSDWMAIEKERGISVTSSVMRFSYRDRELNLLDTPGHEDFSEDTYRVLTAVDSALMVIDSVKGVESQTKKLMEVCRLRDTPILTFINKLDREGRDPLDLLADIEENLKIEATPVTWPIGRGATFMGVYNLVRKELNLVPAYVPAEYESTRIPVDSLNDPEVDRLLGSRAEELRAEVELIEGAGGTFDLDAYRAGRQTPVLFGIAVNGFGVDDLLDTFVEIAPPPLPRPTLTREVSPYESSFSGLVFKIQANMDPAHRDRIAFLRVCSGRFERGIKVRHHRSDRDLRIANATMFLAQDREGVEEAYPGDIIGIPNHGTIRIGDTFSEKELLRFTGIPSFAPEHFRKVRLQNALRAKHLEKALRHLTEEGAIQLFRPLSTPDYILGAVGPLQFDVITARLAAEYDLQVRLESTQFETARWVTAGNPDDLKAFQRKHESNLARDAEDNLTLLAHSDWWLNHTMEQWPQLTFSKTKEHA